MINQFRVPKGRHEKAAMAHLLFAGFFTFFYLLVLFLLFYDLGWRDSYFTAILLGASILLVPTVAINCLIAWGARRKALWARIASIIVAVLAILFGFYFLVGMTHDQPWNVSATEKLGMMLYAIGISSIFVALGVYTLINSRWR